MTLTGLLWDVLGVIDTLAAENSYHLRLWDFTNVLFDFTKEEIQAIARYGKTKFPIWPTASCGHSRCTASRTTTPW